MKIGVFAGTPVDTKMGIDLLEARGYAVMAFPFAQSPLEQTRLQYFSKEKLEELFLEKVNVGKSLGMDKVFLYCNSLSSAIDYKRISKEMDIEIITPLETYENIGKDFKSLVILAANGLSANKIEKTIIASNPLIRIMTLGNLSLVDSIEEGRSPLEIIDKLNLKGFIEYLEKINDSRFKPKALILACTHFPYLVEELKKITSLRIIDPAEEMIRRIAL